MRIIAGRARGTKLKMPKGVETRPTADRIKESLFNILQGRFHEARVLDLFAGTGNLGLEAVSRGAVSALFVDQRTKALIEANIRLVHAEAEAKVRPGDVLAVLGELAARGEQYDLIFADPPYYKGLATSTLQKVARGDLLSEEGILIIEHGIEEAPPPPDGYACVRRVKYGKTTAVSMYGKELHP
ncbi:16S rRNA (guanine(966)-N(2))-methyltransferase RsmD [Selenomonas sp. TAMA-11512]|uniref:16S rRNA (guanine(966)-N(2))-methyltransferase RsmD n=1 Tax=Selenomonas sp. TAMA-11512 TaxID=3095337 RepID=UPI00308FB397|nr:16S rRNA (guanine(966)-N(2))-methyltransferase RsmD [Selenomonas sp. TAMA-11512]